MKVHVNQEACIGCSLCVEVCPKVFRMEAAKAVAFVAEPLAELHPLCRKACEECPVQAIELEEKK